MPIVSAICLRLLLTSSCPNLRMIPLGGRVPCSRYFFIILMYVISGMLFTFPVYCTCGTDTRCRFCQRQEKFRRYNNKRHVSVLTDENPNFVLLRVQPLCDFLFPFAAIKFARNFQISLFMLCSTPVPVMGLQII